MVFVNVQSGGYRDEILREECFRLGEYGFLTVLSHFAFKVESIERGGSGDVPR